MYILVIKQLLTMLLITVVGFIFAKCVKVDDNQQKFLSKLLLYCINPCIVIDAFNIPFDSHKLLQLGFVALIALAVHGIMILLGLISTKEKLDRLGIIFTNCGFVGIPLVRGVFGNEGIFYLMGYIIVFNIILWTYGYYQVAGSISIKNIVTNPNLIAVCCGIILFCLPVELPSVIAKPITMIGDLNTAVAMLLLGILLAQFEFDKAYMWRLIKFLLLRLVVCSILNMLFLWIIDLLFGARIQDCRMMLFVVLICSMCPAATSVPSLACVFDRDKSYASLIVSVSSILCILTVPTFVALAERLF